MGITASSPIKYKCLPLFLISSTTSFPFAQKKRKEDPDEPPTANRQPIPRDDTHVCAVPIAVCFSSKGSIELLTHSSSCFFSLSTAFFFCLTVKSRDGFYKQSDKFLFCPDIFFSVCFQRFLNFFLLTWSTCFTWIPTACGEDFSSIMSGLFGLLKKKILRKLLKNKSWSKKISQWKNCGAFYSFMSLPSIFKKHDEWTANFYFLFQIKHVLQEFNPRMHYCYFYFVLFFLLTAF